LQKILISYFGTKVALDRTEFFLFWIFSRKTTFIWNPNQILSMKTIFNNFLLTLLLGLSGMNSINAQDGYGGHWFLGLNGGAAWQQSDVKSILGGGGGFYLGKNVFYSPTAPLSFDLRFRYLYTATMGQDFMPTNIINNATLNGTGSSFDPNYSRLGYVYHNHLTHFNDLSLEGRINFENLRRKHRIWLSLYGGVGVGIYGVRYDQINGDIFGTTYENLYSSTFADQSLTKDEIINNLIANRDGTYETPMRGTMNNNVRGTITPDVGIELGYWITPRFAIGVGHRVNWTFRDDFDGVIRGNGNNIHHYANLFLHFKLNETGNTRNHPIRNPDPQPNPVVQRPIVDITVPGTSPFTTSSGTTRIACTIRNVETRSGVMMYVNNVAVDNFSFSPSTDVLDAFVSLNMGANTVRITGTNASGSAEDQVTIIYQQNVITPSNPPTVRITNPFNNPFNTNSPNANINATITNVNNASNLTFTVNGQVIRNFNFSGTSFTANGINLVQGNNSVVITASTADGTASDQVNIIYQPVAVNPPTVRITQPGSNPFNTQNSSENIRATITNVRNASDITFTVNGQNIRNFSFSGTSFIANNIALMEGTNSIVISASNNDGNASDMVSINYQPVRVPVQPTVRITQPSADPFTSTAATANIRATITNVPNRTNVNFFVNGQPSSNFSFSGTSFSADNIGLQQGSNTVLISASNQDGTASDQTVIIYQQAQVILNPPTVTITSPSVNPFNTQKVTQGISATITNIRRASDVRFTINGQVNTNFTLNGTAFSAQNVRLNQGNNTVVITATNNDGTASDQTVIIYQLAAVPNPPTVTITNPSANPFNTQTQTQTINAVVTNVPAASGVSFTVNGQTNTNFTLVGTVFTAQNISLNQGNNTVVITATNNDGTASAQTVINYQPTRIPTPPTVTITNPSADPFTATTATQTVNATITNVRGNANVRFTVNGQVNTNFTFTGTSFSAANVQLNEGANTIVISATNNDGNASDQTVINYQPIRVPTPPTVTITNPAADPFTSSVQTQTINATITNVRRASAVTFTVNGQANTSFTLNGTAFTATNIALNQGNNTFVITATNNDGTATDQTVVIYKPMRTPTPPTVVITNPANGVGNSATPNANVNATILNVSNASGVTFTVNGRNVTNFTLNGTAFTANSIRLNEGDNAIVITATNQDGTASDQATIKHVKIQDIRTPTPPTVRITNPSTDPFTSSSPTAVINATVTNVMNAQNVTFSVNGQNIRNFSLNGSNFSATGISLNPGNNTLIVRANNSDGNAADTATIVYNAPLQPPVVTITTPSSNPFTSTTNSTNIRATILNVANSSGVAFMVNGQYVTNFSFSGTSFSANNITLREGANTFTVIGNNSAGTDTKSTVVNYAPVAAPTIGDMTVSVQPQTAGCRVIVYAGLNNVTNNNQITFKINGVVTTGFTFTNGVFNYTYNVTSNNPSTINYEITVNTPGGNTTQTQVGNVGNCVVQQGPPDVRNGNVRISLQNGRCMANVTAQLVNVDNANQISFTVNGQRNTNFTYSNGSFTANIDLSGVNATTISFVITASTPTGNDSESITGTMDNCQSRPVITNMTVAQQQARGNFQATVNANISGVQNANQITFTVNGTRSTAFNFSNGRFTSNALPVNEGRNTFSITATNSAGTDTASKELTVTGNTGGQQNGSNNSGTQNRPIENTDKGKETGKGGKIGTDKDVKKPAAEEKPAGKGGKLNTDKEEEKPAAKGGKLGDKKTDDK
jgi:large repetitive protein